jgi:hypothetical protein
MKWDMLERRVPYMLVFSRQEVPTPILGTVRGTGDAVWVVHPGKHWNTWPTPGGDFKVKIRTCGRERMLSFRQVFEDWELKRDWAAAHGIDTTVLLEGPVADALRQIVVEGASPETVSRTLEKRVKKAYQSGAKEIPGIPLLVLLTAHQCMALAEDRRYGEQTALGGGKYLLVRVVLGIIYGKWTADEARDTTTGNDRSSGRSGGLGALAALEGGTSWTSWPW